MSSEHTPFFIMCSAIIRNRHSNRRRIRGRGRHIRRHSCRIRSCIRRRSCSVPFRPALRW